MKEIRRRKNIINGLFLHMKKILSCQHGSILINVMIMMTALLGFTALVTDVGMTYLERQRLSNAVDAAALAGAKDLQISAAQAKNTAIDYVKKNGIEEDKVQVTVASDNKSIDVKAIDNVDFIFARIIGFNNIDIDAHAKAITASVSATTGARPLAVEKFPLEYGVQYTLKEGAGDGYHGNCGPVALGGTGASNYRYKLKYGYESKLKIGDWIETETGNMPSPTEEGIDFLMNGCTHTPKCTYAQYNVNCTRIIPIPMVNSLHVDGRNDVQIVGFAMFIVEGYQDSGGQLEVLGRFIKYTGAGEVDNSAQNFGFNAVKLVE